MRDRAIARSSATVRAIASVRARTRADPTPTARRVQVSTPCPAGCCTSTTSTPSDRGRSPATVKRHRSPRPNRQAADKIPTTGTFEPQRPPPRPVPVQINTEELANFIQYATTPQVQPPSGPKQTQQQPQREPLPRRSPAQPTHPKRTSGPSTREAATNNSAVRRPL